MLKNSLQTSVNPNLEDSASYEKRINDKGLKGTRFVSGGVKEFWVLDLMSPLENLFVKWKVKPDHLTWAGFFVTVIGSAAIAANHLVWGGWILILAACFDFFDGRVARRLNLSSPAGAFLDSVLDRYMDGVIFMGLAWRFYEQDNWVLILVAIAFLGSMTTPYIRAKAESLGLAGSSGELQRPERLAYISVGCIYSGYAMIYSYPFMEKGAELPPFFLILVLAIIAYHSHRVTFLRSQQVFRQLKKVSTPDQ